MWRNLKHILFHGESWNKNHHPTENVESTNPKPSKTGCLINMFPNTASNIRISIIDPNHSKIRPLPSFLECIPHFVLSCVGRTKPIPHPSLGAQAMSRGPVAQKADGKVATANAQQDLGNAWKCHEAAGGVHSHGGTPIAGWFIREKSHENG